MAHQRQLIRQAISQALIGAGTGAADRVYPSRKLPLRRPELPAIGVYILEEEVDDDSETTAPRELTRRAVVTIEANVLATDAVNVDDAMDAIALEIEAAMAADPSLGGQASDSILAATGIDLIDEGDRMTGLVILSYRVTYYTFAPEPPTDEELDDFETVQATHNPGNDAAAGEEAVDLFTVEEP